MKKLKVMFDFTSSGIWNGKTGVMIDYEDLKKIPPELIQRFEKWINYFDDSFKSDYYTLKKGRARIANSEGLKLAKELKKIYPKYQIEYWGENKKGLWKRKIK
jgi:hypothetical protein